MLEKKVKFKGLNFLTKEDKKHNFFKKVKMFDNFKSNDFFVFNKKFCGVLIYRGKGAYALKFYTLLLERLKNEFKKNPMNIWFLTVKKLMPFFLISQKKYGRRVVNVPILARGNRRNRFVLNWLVRQLRKRSNTLGVKNEDIINLILETYKNRGSALNYKKEFFNLALATKFNLRRNPLHRVALFKLRKERMKKQKEKDEKIMLLRVMLEEDIEEWRRKKRKKRLFKFFFKSISKKGYNIKKYLVN